MKKSARFKDWKIWKNWKLGRNWKRPALIALIVLLSLILTAALIAAVVSTYVFNQIGSALPSETVSVIPPEMEDFETDPPETTQEPTTEPTQPTTEETVPPTTQAPAPTQPNVYFAPVETLQSEDVINLLLVGKDYSSGNSRSRTDSMILLSINKKTNSLSMVSFMRDLYVQIPGYSDNRINAAYRFGGIQLLNATIEKNFGVVIDGNVEVDFAQFRTIVDILGGVDIELTAKEASYLTALGEYGTVNPGLNRLDGRTALEYCRIRQIDSDHQRTERQRKFLMSIANSAKGMSASQMLEVVNKVLPYVYTDLSNGEIINCATTAFQALKSGSGIASGKVPQSGQYYGAKISGMQVMVADLYKCNQYLKSTIYG